MKKIGINPRWSGGGAENEREFVGSKTSDGNRLEGGDKY